MQYLVVYEFPSKKDIFDVVIPVAFTIIIPFGLFGFARNRQRARRHSQRPPWIAVPGALFLLFFMASMIIRHIQISDLVSKNSVDSVDGAVVYCKVINKGSDILAVIGHTPLKFRSPDFYHGPNDCTPLEVGAHVRATYLPDFDRENYIVKLELATHHDGDR